MATLIYLCVVILLAFVGALVMNAAMQYFLLDETKEEVLNNIKSLW